MGTTEKYQSSHVYVIHVDLQYKFYSMCFFIALILLPTDIKAVQWELNCLDVQCCRYQTGALTPLVRWLSQGMHRAAVPPHPPRPAVRAENVPPPARQGIENAALAGNF